MGAVYWITGFSGAGKTTIGKVFAEKLRSRHGNTVLLDGDALRQVFDNDLGYSEEDRRKCAMRYARLCKLLQEQGLHVVCCTVSMYCSVRQWNRENIRNYREIYVKVTERTLRMRDQKGLYSNYMAGKEKQLAGKQVGLEEPVNPDLILENDGARSPEEQADIIYSHFIERL